MHDRAEFGLTGSDHPWCSEHRIEILRQTELALMDSAVVTPRERAGLIEQRLEMTGITHVACRKDDVGGTSPIDRILILATGELYASTTE